jgi:aspartyl-tRNA(Asn)/glutamyl-tRNA(Gln) amidotransferase subunit A
LPLNPLRELTVAQLAARVRGGTVSAREAVGASLEAIEAEESSFHAFVTIDREGALAAADSIDQRRRSGEAVGALAGIPVAIKDLLSTKGLRTTFGSAHYATHVPCEDDIAVARLRRADAVVIGKTNTSEFGYGAIPRNSLFPATRNPWNLDLGPGGSSAGSAAAVAARLVPLALGSDGGGSIRMPAALTGLVGFKPSWGRVPVYPGCRDERLPGASGWESLEHIGPMTQSVADARLAYAVLTGPHANDRHSLPLETSGARPEGPVRIAYGGAMWTAALDPEVAAICERAAAALASALGASLEAASPPLDDVQQTFEAIVALETDRDGLRGMRAASGIGFSATLTRLLDTAWTADQFSAALIDRKRISRLMAEFMASHDLLITPATASAAVPIDLDHPPTIAGREIGSAGFAPFLALANLTGQPAIVVPAGLTADGRPVGLQIIGRHLGDEALLDAAEAYEQAIPFPRLLDKSVLTGQSFGG